MGHRARSGGLVLNGFTGIVTGVAFSPDGKRIFALNSLKVLAWSAEDGTPVAADNLPVWLAPGSIRLQDGRLAVTLENDRVTIVDGLGAPHAWPLPDAAERKRYHTGQAALAEKEQKWFVVAFHVGRLLLDDPDNADLKKRRDEAMQNHASN